VATPACRTHADVENALPGTGAQTRPEPHTPPAAVLEGEQARATRDQAAGGVVAVPPVPAQVPPVATGAATSRDWATGFVALHDEVTVCVPWMGTSVPHELSM
jgi:hypothetical protein